MTKEIVDRRAGRVLLINDRNEVLLFRGCDPAVPEEKYWFSVGGGIDEGEDVRQAACRELFEETGLRAEPGDLGEQVHHELAEFGFKGRWYRQENVFYSLRVTDPVIDTSGFEEIEAATMDDHRWWSLNDLEATSERYYPPELVEIVKQLIE